MTNVNEVLARKRVQIVGLDLSLSEELTEIFRNAGAEVITDGSADLIVAPPGAAQHVNPATPHLIIVDSLDAMEQQRRGEHSDFLIAPPLRIDEVLLRAFRLLIGSRRGGSGATPSVLAVDDDATTTAIVRAVLTRSGMTCHVAANGKQALESARALKPSAIILDVNMPYIDGFEVLSTLRNDPETADVPIVMLTSVQQESDIVRGFGLGADDYVVKPFNPMELLARIRRLVRK
ncbi:MAG TPA: response regulator [Thermoanaerobaculia bacterium]|nr:response regulator [Thermoanaerobaculia bacterium]